MNVTAVAMLIAFIGLLTYIIYFTFPLVQICGDSMLPNFTDGEVVLGRRVTAKFHEFKVGEVYVYYNPFKEADEVYVVKRLTRITKWGDLYFEGDNPSVSFDSRYYGFISKELVVAKVIYKKGGMTNGKLQEENN